MYTDIYSMYGYMYVLMTCSMQYLILQVIFSWHFSLKTEIATTNQDPLL